MILDRFHLFSFLLLSLSIAQLNAQSLTINRYDLNGIVKNDDNYLRKFVTLTEGEQLDMNKLNFINQQLIRRTGVANSIIEIDTINSSAANITFNIEEQRTLLPQLGIGGIKENFWWQVGLAEYNLGGKEKTLIGTYMQNDKQPNFQVFYQNQRINGGRWGYALDITRQSSIEPLYFPESTVIYKYANFGTGATLMYHPDFNRRLSVGFSVFREDYNKDNPQDIGVSEGPDELVENKFLLRAQYQINKLQYDYFYREGHQIDLLAQTVNTIENGNRFVSLSFEGKRFWRTNNGNIATRIRAAIATNTPSPFAPFVLDSKVNLRGVGNRVDRGTAQLVLNVEYRHTVFHSDKFAGQVVGFADLGAWRNPGGDLSDLFDSDLFREFVGFGVRFINKKVFRSILRLDYGIDIANTSQRGFVFGVGQYF